MSRTKFTRNFYPQKLQRFTLDQRTLQGRYEWEAWQLFIADARTNVLHSGEWQEFIDTLNRTL